MFEHNKKTYFIATLYKVLNLLSFTLCSLILSLKLSQISVPQQFVMVYLLSSIMILCYFCFARQRKPLVTNLIAILNSKKRILFYLGRALCTAVGMICWLEAINKIGLTQATTIAYLTPIFTSAFAIFFLKENANISWIISLTMGAIGSYYTVVNSGVWLSFGNILGLLYGFASTIAWALYDIICKKQTEKENSLIQVFITFFLSSLIMMPFLFFNFTFISLIEFSWLLLTSVLAIFSVTMLFMSYRLAPLTRLIPHSYLRLLFAISAMYFIKDEIPSREMIIGMIAILLGNFILMYDHQKLSAKI